MSNSPNERPEEPEAAPEKVGKILREARLAAKIEMNKICTDLRISPQALEALEQGNYHQLSGDPYIRALLGSLARYLNLDPQALVKLYNQEIGAVHAAPSIAPYKDKAHTYTAAHKQIFVAIVLALIVVMVLFIGKLNKGEGFKGAPAMNPSSPAESLAVPQDTGVESKSLAPDSSASKTTLPADAKGLGDGKASVDTGHSAHGTSAHGAGALPHAPAAPPNSAAAVAPVVTATPTATPPGASAAADTAGLNVAIVKPLIDSVGVKVMRSGKEDFATLLRLGKQMQVSHNDTITIFISKRKSVEVMIGGKTVIPERKRFKIYGNTLKTY